MEKKMEATTLGSGFWGKGLKCNITKDLMSGPEYLALASGALQYASWASEEGYTFNLSGLYVALTQYPIR